MVVCKIATLFFLLHVAADSRKLLQTDVTCTQKLLHVEHFCYMVEHAGFAYLSASEATGILQISITDG
jgi:hypothetical protein